MQSWLSLHDWPWNLEIWDRSYPISVETCWNLLQLGWISRLVTQQAMEGYDFWESFPGIITKQRPRICGDPLVIISMADWKLGYGNIPIISPCHRWFFVFFRFSMNSMRKTVHIVHKNSHSSQFNPIHPNKFFPHFPSCAAPSLVGAGGPLRRISCRWTSGRLGDSFAGKATIWGSYCMYDSGITYYICNIYIYIRLVVSNMFYFP